MKKTKRGFTLVELVVVIAILLILSVIAVSVVTSQIGAARESACASNRRSLKLEILTGYVSGKYSSLEEAFEAVASDGRFICPSGGELSWVSGGNSGHAACSVHSSHEDIGGVPGESFVVLTDSSGGRHIIMPSASWEEVQQKITDGWNIPPGYVIADGSGSFLCYSWRNSYIKEDVSGISAEEFAASRPELFTELKPSGRVLTDADRVLQNSDMVWSAPPRTGDICYMNGKYYVAPNDIGIWTMPPGGWIEIVR